MSKCDCDIKKISAIIAVIVAVAWYGVERISEIFFSFNKTNALVLALLSTVVLAVVYFLIDSCTDSFSGMLASLIAFKMTPPSIGGLAALSYDAAFLYFIVQKAAVLMFIYLFVKHYRKDTDGKISPFAVLVLAFAVPFLSRISNSVALYLMHSFGENMLFSYFSDFVFYGLAIFVAWLIALKGNYNLLKFVTCYEIIALSINLLRKACYMFVLMAKHEHVSLSFYCWILIFGFGIVLFAFTYKQRKNSLLIVKD